MAHLTGIGLIVDNVAKTPIDMDVHTAAIQKVFGLSRQALEIRFSELRLPMVNARYV